MNVSRATIQSYEKGKTIPKMQVLKDMATLLECDVNWLMGGEPGAGDSQPKSIPGGITEQLKKMHNQANMVVRRDKSTNLATTPRAVLEAWQDIDLKDFDENGVGDIGSSLEMEYLESLKEGSRIHFVPPMLPTLDPGLFWELWETYVNEDITHKGWVQIEVTKRFPEFVKWLKLYFKKLDASENSAK